MTSLALGLLGLLAAWALAPTPVAAARPFIADSLRQAERAMAATAGRPPTETMLTLARRWLGRPYEAFSLDQGMREELRINLGGFDCFLLVEQLLALANSDNARSFADLVQRLRYENGSVTYCQRHHYFSRWAQAAERAGWVRDLSPSLPGATKRQRRLDFMGHHLSSYRPLQQPANRACLLAKERSLTVTQTYVPLSDLRRASPGLRSGDIFALVTRVPGLDVTHVGILERSGGSLNALHASPGRGVMRSRDMAAYAARVPEVIGVSFLRPTEPGGRAGDSARQSRGR